LEFEKLIGLWLKIKKMASTSCWRTILQKNGKREKQIDPALEAPTSYHVLPALIVVQCSSSPHGCDYGAGLLRQEETKQEICEKITEEKEGKGKNTIEHGT
jgi:hypothetical protein